MGSKREARSKTKFYSSFCVEFQESKSKSAHYYAPSLLSKSALVSTFYTGYTGLFTCPQNWLWASRSLHASCAPAMAPGKAILSSLQVLNKYLWEDGRKRGRERRRVNHILSRKMFPLTHSKGKLPQMGAEGCWEWTWEPELLHPVGKGEWDRIWRRGRFPEHLA